MNVHVGNLESHDQEFSCPTCSSDTETVLNPFYGTGMSVHEYMRECVHCDWIAAIPNARAGEPPAIIENDRPRGLFAKMRRISIAAFGR